VVTGLFDFMSSKFLRNPDPRSVTITFWLFSLSSPQFYKTVFAKEQGSIPSVGLGNSSGSGLGISSFGASPYVGAFPKS